MSAHLSEAEAQAIVNRAAILCNEFEKYLFENAYSAGPSAANSKLNFVTHADNYLIAAREAAVIQNKSGTDEKHAELELGVHSAVAAFRASLSGVKGQASSILAPALRILGRFYGFTETDPSEIVDKIYGYFVDTGRRVQSRNLTVGSVSADSNKSGGSNDGSGALYLRSTMSTGDPCDNLWPEKVLFRCTADEHSGATEHREVFSVEGEPSHPDGISVAGSGAVSSVTALTPTNSIALNSSFTSYSGAAGTPTFTNWTAAGGTANIDAESGAGLTYRDSTGESTAVSIKFNADETITQNFNVRNVQMDRGVPYFWHIAYKPGTSSAAGDLKVTIGDTSTSTKAFNGASSTAWQVHTGSIFYTNINKEDPVITIEVDFSSSGHPLYVDDFIFAPMSEFNGLYYALIGGATPFLVGDGFSFTVSEPALASRKGLVNEWLWKAYNKYLPCEASPNASATPNDWIDPTDYS